MNYHELKDFCNSINEKHLTEEVAVIVGESSERIVAELTTGNTYSYDVTCSIVGCYSGTPSLDVSGRYLYLKYYDARGISGAVLASSQNCIVDDFTKDVDFISNGLKVDSATDRSVSLQQGQSTVQFRAYSDISQLNYAYTYNNVPAVCDQPLKKVYGYTKYSGIEGSCYAIADTSAVLLDGTTKPLFACTDSVCQTVYGLSSDYKSKDFFCQKAESTVQCLVDSSCQYLNQYISNDAGTTIERKGYCSDGTCKYNDVQIACNPTVSYPNNQCCKKNLLGAWTFEACSVPLKLCTDLGSDACCTEKQSRYIVKQPPSGQYCCDKDNDGIGKITETEALCFGNDVPNVGFNLFDLIGKFAMNLLGGLIIGIIIVIALALLAVLGIALFLRFILKPQIAIVIVILIALMLAFGFTAMTAQFATMVIG